MKVLFIETSTEKSCIALFDGTKYYYVPLAQGPELSKTIAQEVDHLLATKNIIPEKIVVGKGPGSLTGSRVGRSLAKALAFGWGVPLEEVCSMKPFIPDKSPFAVLFDARSGGIYVLTEEGEPELFSPEEAKEKVRTIPLLVSPHPEQIKKRIGRSCSICTCDFSKLSDDHQHM